MKSSSSDSDTKGYVGRAFGIPEGITLKEYLPPDLVDILHPAWHNYPPESPFLGNILALIYIIMGLLAFFGNLLVIHFSIRYAGLRTPSNLLIMNLAFTDLMVMASLLPECIFNFFMGGVWQFGDLACQIHAFCCSLFGYAQITTLVFISFDRFNAVVKGADSQPLTYRKAVASLVFVWMYSFFWAVGPLIGYGSYALDGILASCSFGYMNNDITHISYIAGCLIAAYFLPLLIISGLYYHIVKAVFTHESSMRKQREEIHEVSIKTIDAARKRSLEIKIAKSALLNVTLWVFAWTPFAIICLIGAFGDHSKLTPLITSLPVLFAKTSCVYNPIIYALSHPRYRKYLKRAVPWLGILKAPGDIDSISSGCNGSCIIEAP